MTRNDIASIRRRFAPDKHDISIIRGCYVNEKSEIVSTFSKSPVSLPESEAEHYLSTFKKTLGGTPGRNQFTLPVDLDAPCGNLLRQLHTSDLTDEAKPPLRSTIPMAPFRRCRMPSKDTPNWPPMFWR